MSTTENEKFSYKPYVDTNGLVNVMNAIEKKVTQILQQQHCQYENDKICDSSADLSHSVWIGLYGYSSPARQG